jgi:hypothetical protein
MPAISLTDLQQHIAQRERELQALREELQTRQSHFSELTRRKEELQRQLQQVEQDIAALESATASATERSTPATPTAPSGSQPRLGELIETLLREAAEPMTARLLLEEAKRRGHQPTSQDPIKAVGNRLQFLKSQGIVQRASGQPGFILVSSMSGAKKKSKASQPAQTSTQKVPAKPAKSEPTAKTAKPGRRGGQTPLRVVLTNILKSSRKPLSGRVLAERALAAGYQTENKKFLDSVYSILGQMDNVEHLPQEGYRLKKT